jgi:hypothetical protein
MVGVVFTCPACGRRVAEREGWQPGSDLSRYVCPEHGPTMAAIEPDDSPSHRIRVPGWRHWSEWEREEVTE